MPFSSPITERAGAHKPPQLQDETGDPPPPARMDIHVPPVTFIKVGVFAIVASMLYVLGPLLLVVFLACFLAVALHALVDWLDGRGLRHRASLAIVIGGFLTTLALVAAYLVPPLFQQVAALTRDFNTILNSSFAGVPMGEEIRSRIEGALNHWKWEEVGTAAKGFFEAGTTVLAALAQFVLLIVIALYLLVDGKSLYDWLLAFFSPEQRRKLHQTAQEVSRKIFGYVAAQVTTSTLVALYSYCVLGLLGVPGALLLALLAGLMDIIPVLGFIVATIIATLVALSVSPQTALAVLLLYAAFQTLEGYWLIPRVHGRNMRVSMLTVLLGLFAGGMLAGIPGAIASLPIVASYGAVESIWLKPYLREGVAEKHEKLKDDEFGEE